MENYKFVVIVKTKNRDEAERVMAERINHDEDYGFPYQIEWESPR